MKNLLALLLLGILAVGCNSNSNQAATPDNSNPSSGSGQPASNPNTTSNPSNTSSNPDQQFVSDAAKGNRAEIELGKMVESKAKDPSVKSFARMMVNDHTKALNELQQIAQSNSWSVPEGIPEDAQDMKTKLSSESGKQMEKDYMDGMVQDHQKDVKDFQDASQNVQNNDLKQWATKTLPTLQKHLQRAQQIDSKMGGGKPQTGE